MTGTRRGQLRPGRPPGRPARRTARRTAAPSPGWRARPAAYTPGDRRPRAEPAADGAAALPQHAQRRAAPLLDEVARGAVDAGDHLVADVEPVPGQRGERGPRRARPRPCTVQACRPSGARPRGADHEQSGRRAPPARGAGRGTSPCEPDVAHHRRDRRHRARDERRQRRQPARVDRAHHDVGVELAGRRRDRDGPPVADHDVVDRAPRTTVDARGCRAGGRARRAARQSRRRTPRRRSAARGTPSGRPRRARRAGRARRRRTGAPATSRSRGRRGASGAAACAASRGSRAARRPRAAGGRGPRAPRGSRGAAPPSRRRTTPRGRPTAARARAERVERLELRGAAAPAARATEPSSNQCSRTQSSGDQLELLLQRAAGLAEQVAHARPGSSV